MGRLEIPRRPQKKGPSRALFYSNQNHLFNQDTTVSAPVRHPTLLPTNETTTHRTCYFFALKYNNSVSFKKFHGCGVGTKMGLADERSKLRLALGLARRSRTLYVVFRPIYKHHMMWLKLSLVVLANFSKPFRDWPMKNQRPSYKNAVIPEPSHAC